MTAVVAALAVAVLLLTVLVVGLLRSHAEILKALHELGAGLELDGSAPGPDTVEGVVPPRRAAGTTTPRSIVGDTLEGESVALPLVGRGDTLLAFLSSGCTTCQDFWRAFRRGVQDVPGDAQLVVVTRGLDEESAGALQERAPAGLPLVLSDQAWDGFEVPGSPYFVYVDAEGRVVGEGAGASWPQVADLMKQARADAAAREAARVRGGGAVRQSRDEQALAAAGILPGDPSLRS